MAVIPELANFTGKLSQAGANLSARASATVQMLQAGHSINLQTTNVPRTFEEKLFLQRLAQKASK